MKPIYFTLLVALTLFSSCLRHKDFLMFRDGSQPTPNLVQTAPKEILQVTELLLQPNDVLAVLIASAQTELAQPFNLGGGQGAIQAVSPLSPVTFLIDQQGFINLPGIGSIQAAGLTVNQLRDSVFQRVSQTVVNPSVAIRLINFKVSVTGEVESQMIVNVESERITLLEAIARAGGLTPYSNREHVLVIREKNGKREVGEVNLQSPGLFNSPYYFLQQNDVIYVEPTKQAIAKAQQPIVTYLQPVQVGISLIALIIALFR